MREGKLKIDIRRAKIMEFLQKSGKVQVSELSQLFGATPVTIRSDLDALERDGFLIRVLGGAMLKQNLNEKKSELKQIPQSEEKQAIAKAVAAQIPNGSTLFLNSGTTTECVADALKNHKNLNIVTNSLAVAQRLGAHPFIHVLLLGGEINIQHGFTHGTDAEEQLSRYQADWSILSVDGVSTSGGLTSFHAEETNVNRMMIERAQHIIIAADYTKIGRRGFTYINAAAAPLKLVTDCKCSQAAAAELEEQGVEVTITEV